MSTVKKNMIEQAILRLSPGAYQNLMEDYLIKKHKYSNINALGTHTGTDKTTQGTPDTFVSLENGRFILINYGTVGQNSFAKIKADILSCLDENKTKIPVESIEQIICCHTSTNLNPGQVRELLSLFANVELVGITTVAYDLMDKYQMLALASQRIQIHIALESGTAGINAHLVARGLDYSAKGTDCRHNLSFAGIENI